MRIFLAHVLSSCQADGAKGMSATDLSNKEQLLPVILLIENEESDVFLFRRALSRLNFIGVVRVVGSVSEAREYLEGRGRFADRSYDPLPDLIVSDMNLS